MAHCQFCGGFLITINRGGCGGYGSIKECMSCKRKFKQITGGIVSTPGGETFRPIEELPEIDYKLLKDLFNH